MNETKRTKVAKDILHNQETLQETLHCGLPTARQIAKDAGAIVRIGGRVLYSASKIEEYVNCIATNE